MKAPSCEDPRAIASHRRHSFLALLPRWFQLGMTRGGSINIQVRAGLAGTPQKVQLWNRKDDFCKNRGAATVCGALRRPLKWRRVAHEAGVSEPGQETERTWPPPAGVRASRGAGGFFIVHARGRPAKAGTLGRNWSWRTDDRRMTGSRFSCDHAGGLGVRFSGGGGGRALRWAGLGVPGPRQTHRRGEGRTALSAGSGRPGPVPCVWARWVRTQGFSTAHCFTA